MKKENIEKIKSATIVVLVLIIVFGASYFMSELQECDNGGNTTTTSSANNSSSNDSSDISEDEQGDLNEIGIDEYLDLKEGSEASIIYVARPKPIVKNIVYEYGVTVNYLNTDELDDEGQAEFIKSDDYFEEKGGYGTPMLIIVKDDEFVDVLEGLTDKDTVVKFFKDNGLIEE